MSKIIRAEEGWGQILKGADYYLAPMVAEYAHVVLFHWRTSAAGTECVPSVYSFQHDVFQQAVDSLVLSINPGPVHPPWHDDPEALVNRAFSTSPSGIIAARREQTIEEVCASAPDIFACEDPLRRCAKFAKAAGVPSQRFAFWFLTYQIFGKSRSALSPRYRVARKKDSGGAKRGRKSKAQIDVYRSAVSSEDATRIVEHFAKRYVPGTSWTNYHGQLLSELSQARVVELTSGVQAPIPGVGENLYSKDQVLRVLTQALGRSELDRLRWGENRKRKAKSGDQGHVAEHISSLCFDVEEDGQFLRFFPTDEDGNALPRPLVVRLICRMSGNVLGIGFSARSERLEAYECALFCAAVPKKYFASLFGIAVENSQWPAIGLPAIETLDRGPGSSGSLDNRAGIVAITESDSGQSKPVVEGAHQQLTPLRKGHRVKSGGLIAVCRDEIFATLEHQASSQRAAGRISGFLETGLLPTPNNLWTYFDERGRNAASLISITEAVRRFLPRCKIHVSASGVFFYGREFRCLDDPRVQGLKNSAVRGEFDIDGWVFPMAVRYIWAEIAGDVVQLEACLPIADDEETLYQTLDELERDEQSSKQLRAEGELARLTARLYWGQKNELGFGRNHHQYNAKRGGSPVKDANREYLRLLAKAAGSS